MVFDGPLARLERIRDPLVARIDDVVLVVDRTFCPVLRSTVIWPYSIGRAPTVITIASLATTMFAVSLAAGAIASLLSRVSGGATREEAAPPVQAGLAPAVLLLRGLVASPCSAAFATSSGSSVLAVEVADLLQPFPDGVSGYSARPLGCGLLRLVFASAIAITPASAFGTRSRDSTFEPTRQ